MYEIDDRNGECPRTQNSFLSFVYGSYMKSLKKALKTMKYAIKVTWRVALKGPELSLLCLESDSLLTLRAEGRGLWS